LKIYESSADSNNFFILELETKNSELVIYETDSTKEIQPLLDFLNENRVGYSIDE